MSQFNLLPDVKLEYLKAERTRRLVISISVVVTLVAVALVVLLFMFTLFQKKHLSDLNTDIKHQSSQLEGQKDLNKVLTIQNQLQSLDSLHAAKPAMTRLPGYLNQITPAQATISSLTIDNTQKTMQITGSADSLSTVNQFVDTLKFTTYKADSDTATPAFTNVVLATFGLGTSNASYSISLTFDPIIFDITKKVTLTVPQQVTTRSEVEQPADLFKQSPAPVSNSGNSR